MRLNRVLALLALAVTTGIAVIWMEGQNLRLQQKLAELHRQRETLIEEQSRLRVAISRTAAPAQLMDSLRQSDSMAKPPTAPAGTRPAIQPYLQR